MNIKETIANISRMKWELETALEENGDVSKIGQFVYPSADAAFDAACNALNTLL